MAKAQKPSSSMGHTAPLPEWLKAFAVIYMIGFWSAYSFCGHWRWFWWVTVAFPLCFCLLVMAIVAFAVEKKVDRKIASERRQRGKPAPKGRRTDYGRVKYPPIVSAVGTASLFLAFFALFSASSIQLTKGILSQWWDRTKGTVLYNDIDSWWSPEHSVRIKVGYAYTVENREYVSDRVTFGYKFYTSHSATEELQSYPVGSGVDVFYNPGDPKDAVLQPGVHGTFWILYGLLLGFAFTASTLGLIFDLYKKSHDSDRPRRVGTESLHI